MLGATVSSSNEIWPSRAIPARITCAITCETTCGLLLRTLSCIFRWAHATRAYRCSITLPSPPSRGWRVAGIAVDLTSWVPLTRRSSSTVRLRDSTSLAPAIDQAHHMGRAYRGRAAIRPPSALARRLLQIERDDLDRSIPARAPGAVTWMNGSAAGTFSGWRCERRQETGARPAGSG